jgi:hypothetical protein
VAHACNPSYSGGRDQEDLSSQPALGKQQLLYNVTRPRYTTSQWTPSPT